MEIRNPNKVDTYSGIWVFDIEGDNLYHGITVMHCLWLIDPVTGYALGFRPDEVKDSFVFLENAKLLIAHNGIGFDIPAIRKLFPMLGKVNILDTLILASMLQPNRLQQSLDSWGKDLGEEKDSFGKKADWSVYTEEMYEYCYQDVVVTVKLILTLCKMAGIDVQDLPVYTM
ncbi:MAG: hypothetical protein ACRC6R_08030 [Bacteroidales bacterium]